MARALGLQYDGYKLESHHRNPNYKFLHCYKEFLCPVEPLYFFGEKSQLRNDKYIIMQYNNWINSTPSKQ